MIIGHEHSAGLIEALRQMTLKPLPKNGEGAPGSNSAKPPAGPEHAHGAAHGQDGGGQIRPYPLGAHGQPRTSPFPLSPASLMAALDAQGRGTEEANGQGDRSDRLSRIHDALRAFIAARKDLTAELKEAMGLFRSEFASLRDDVKSFRLDVKTAIQGDPELREQVKPLLHDLRHAVHELDTEQADELMSQVTALLEEKGITLGGDDDPDPAAAADDTDETAATGADDAADEAAAGEGEETAGADETGDVGGEQAAAGDDAADDAGDDAAAGESDGEAAAGTGDDGGDETASSAADADAVMSEISGLLDELLVDIADILDQADLSQSEDEEQAA